MTTTYYFYSAGALPIIGGIYAGVAVEVNEAHNAILSITTLGQAVIVEAEPSPQSSKSSPIPAIEEVTPVAEENPEIKES